jgi:4-hydroxybenzoate polyprenyltransferase
VRAGVHTGPASLNAGNLMSSTLLPLPAMKSLIWDAIKSSVGYVIIVLFCLIGGATANLTRPTKPLLTIGPLDWSITSDPIAFTIIATLIYFFGYCVARSLLIDRPHVERLFSVKTAIIAALVICIILYVGMALIFLILGRFSFFVLVLCTTFPATAMFFTTCYLEHNNEPNVAHKFLPKIFYPAFSICFLSFCLGWVLFDEKLNGFWILCGFSALILILFFGSYYRRNAPPVIAVLLGALLASTIACTIIFYDEIGTCLLIALLWTFALGVAEVAKRPYLVQNAKAVVANDESAEFYIAGANWASILFLNFLLLMPLLVANNLMFTLLLVVWTLLFIWHATPQKDSRRAYVRALIIGYGLPIAVIFLMLLGKSPWLQLTPPNTGVQTDRLVTLLGVFLTIIFVLYPREFRQMPQDLSKRTAFLTARSCLLFATFAIAVQAVLVTFMVSVLSAMTADIRALQFQVDLVLLILILELLVVLLLLFFTTIGGKLDGNPQDSVRADNPGSNAANVAIQPVLSGVKAAIEVARPAISVIAGFLAFAFAQKAAGVDAYFALGAFVCATALCMFGFVVNDIFDRHKDLAGLRLDKPIATGLLSVEAANVLAVILSLGALVSSSFLGGAAFAITLGGVGILVFYSHFARAFPKVKGIYTGVLCCLPILIGTPNFSEVSLISLLVLIVFIFGREIVIDVVDADGDRRAAHITIPVSWGQQGALQIAWSAMVASLCIALVIQESAIGVAFAVGGLATLMLLILLHTRVGLERFVSLSRVTMLLVICSAVASS